MHPKYEVIRNAIDEGKQVTWTNRLLKRSSCYLKKEQKNIGQCLRKSVLCVHQQKQWAFIKNFEKAYLSYVAGCEEMIQSIDLESGVDEDLFNTSEAKQDQATDQIDSCHPKND